MAERSGSAPSSEDVLKALAEAVERRTHLPEMRARAAQAVGERQLVEAVGVSAFFCGITRLADATGVALPGEMQQRVSDARKEFGLAPTSA